MKSWVNNTDDDQAMPEKDADQRADWDGTAQDDTAQDDTERDDSERAMRSPGLITAQNENDAELPEDDQVVLAVADEPAGETELTGETESADETEPGDEADLTGTEPAGTASAWTASAETARASQTVTPGSAAAPVDAAVEPDLAAVDPDGAAMAAQADAMRASSPDAGPGGTGSGDDGSWSEIQVKFVDDPRASVEMAAALVNDRVTALVGSVKDRQSSLASVLQGGEADTERLRTTLQQYRVFCSRLDGFSLES